MRALTFVIAALAASALPSASEAKTIAQCNAEYAANKANIQGSGEKKKDFVTRCRADTAAATSPTAPATPAAPAAPASPSASTANEPSRADPTPAAPAPRSRRAERAPATDAAAAKSNLFNTEAEAKAHCPSDTVVWANTSSKIYHFAGTRNYGNTKSGAYMCRGDTTSSGMRAAKNERQRG